MKVVFTDRNDAEQAIGSNQTTSIQAASNSGVPAQLPTMDSCPDSVCPLFRATAGTQSCWVAVRGAAAVVWYTPSSSTPHPSSRPRPAFVLAASISQGLTLLVVLISTPAGEEADTERRE